MQKKKFWVIFLTFIVFLAGAVLGVANVYRVDDVVVKFDYVSELSEKEAHELTKGLEKAYKGQSTLFVENTEAKKLLKDFPYFRMTSFSTKQPNKVIVKVVEDEEIYAVQKQDGSFYILGANGVVLGERATSDNRSDGGTNVRLTGFSVSGKKGEKLSGQGVETAISFLNVLSGKFGGVRNNILQAEWQAPATSATFLTLQTVEGVKLVIENPDVLLTEKAERLAAYYLSLADGARITGEVWVAGASAEEIRVEYVKNP